MALQDCALNLNRTGRELQPHGTPDFPCAGYSSVYTDSAGDVVPWHWHEDLEIIYVESGHLRLQVPGKTFQALSSIPIYCILPRQSPFANSTPWSFTLYW